MAIQTLYPDIKPTLNLDFANTEKLDPRITFARASSARSYDGKTVAKAEENLLTYSQEFDNAVWVNVVAGTGVAPVVTANAGVAPDGTTTAEKIEFSLGGGTLTADISRIRQNYSVINGTTYTFSVFLKSFDGSSSYDLHLVGADGLTQPAITVTGTWTRFTVTVSAISSAQIPFSFGLRGGQSPANSNTAEILAWGAQLEQRSSVTAYTVTTTQPITNYIPTLLTATDNVARFDHNPTTGESLGLLVEEQRTNLLTYSEQFDDAAWSTGASTITANTIVSPAGTLTGDKLVEDSTNNTHIILPASSISFTSGTSYTQSIYAKAAERTFLQLRTTVTNTFSASFNLSTGVASEITANTTASVVAVGNGWYRCSITFTAPSTLSTTTVRFGSMLNATTQSYQGDDYSGIYIWGAQLEAGAFATS